jgi:hypothetical protein
MPGSVYPIVSGILLLTVITIAYGGTFVLRVTRGNVPAPTTCRKASSGPDMRTPAYWSSSVCSP